MTLALGSWTIASVLVNIWNVLWNVLYDTWWYIVLQITEQISLCFCPNETVCLCKHHWHISTGKIYEEYICISRNEIAWNEIIIKACMNGCNIVQHWTNNVGRGCWTIVGQRVQTDATSQHALLAVNYPRPSMLLTDALTTPYDPTRCPNLELRIFLAWLVLSAVTSSTSSQLST